MRKVLLSSLAALLCLGCSGKDSGEGGTAAKNGEESKTLVVYVGRNLSLVKPLLETFQKKHGIEVKTRDGKSGALAGLLLEEGAKSKADVFWAQDADSLAQVEGKGLFAPLPIKSVESESPLFAGRSAHWLPISGRARVLAYNPTKISKEDLPKSILELTDPKYAGQVGWAPTNASFKSFVTALRATKGEAAAKAWLDGMKANGAKKYAKNTPIISALGAGEISMGLPNHYYLLRKKATNKDFPVEQAFFADGDIGNLINVSGAGILKGAKNKKNAETFLKFLVSKEAQQYFADKTFEYPVRSDVKANETLEKPEDLPRISPKIDLKQLSDLKGTLKTMRASGLL